MSSDENTTQNPIFEENSIPPSPTSFDSAQDLSENPMADAPILPIDSEPAEVPSLMQLCCWLYFWLVNGFFLE